MINSSITIARFTFGMIVGCLLPYALVAAKAATFPDAHDASRAFILDPTYNAKSLSLAPDVKLNVAPWIYGEGQLEAWTIDRVVKNGFAVNKYVDYKRNYDRFGIYGDSPCTWRD